MKKKYKTIIIAKDDFPLEHIRGRFIKNIIRKLRFASHQECWKCYENRKGIKVSNKPVPNK